jgi:hypothetical protein
MKLKFLNVCVLAVMLIGSHVAAFAAAGGSGTVRAILVLASNEKGASDGRLAAYEPTLRRILRFESYKLVGEGSAALAGAGKASVKLGRGHSVELEAEKSDGKGVRLKVNWQDGGRSLMNTGLVLRPGVPAVLGGPANGKGGEVWAVILVAD